jgi:mannose-6-phosphate isomerase-like protein (cupin superfamily)
MQYNPSNYFTSQMQEMILSAVTHFNDVSPYTTRDGSQIFELMHPDKQGNSNQSLALAVIFPGEKTKLHKHLQSEEIYYIQSGTGSMILGDDKFEIITGDTICIAPGNNHNVENTGTEELKILCCCSPAYSHTDTVLKDDQ